MSKQFSEDKKRILIIAIITGLLALMMVTIYCLLTTYNPLFNEFGRSSSENGKYEIVLLGDEPFVFGETNVIIYWKWSNSFIRHKAVATTISNDGKMLDEDNYAVIWDDKGVEIILSGEEQSDQNYYIEIDH